VWHRDLGPKPYERRDADDEREGGSLWIEAPDALLKPDSKTKVVSAVNAVMSMNRNITTNNDSNMLVCKVDLSHDWMPKIKETDTLDTQHAHIPLTSNTHSHTHL